LSSSTQSQRDEQEDRQQGDREDGQQDKRKRVAKSQKAGVSIFYIDNFQM